jgi:hypothetical protein
MMALMASSLAHALSQVAERSDPVYTCIRSAETLDLLYTQQKALKKVRH